MASRLPKGIDKSDVNYSTFIVLQGVMFVLMALCLFSAVEPFLEGKPLGESIWHAVGTILSFGASAVTWTYVKAANRAAALAILREAREA
jgi:hypothetical protein